MKYRIEDLIDIKLLQELQDGLDRINHFPAALMSTAGEILTSTSWQEICTKFHRMNPETASECAKTTQYINDRLNDANPTLIYECPFHLYDSATPIIIEGEHIATFHTGQFFLEKPDLLFYEGLADKYGFDKKEYLEAVEKVPVWSREKVDNYIVFIKSFIQSLARMGLARIKESEAAETIKENEERYRNIIRTAMDGFWAVNFKGKLLDVNEAACKMLGYSFDEMLKLKINDIEATENREDTNKHIDHIIAAGSDRFETRHKRKDGKIINVELSVALSENHDFFYCFIRDITDSKRSAEENVKVKKELEQFFDLVPDMVCIASPNGYFKKVNHAWSSVLGYTEKELLSIPFTDLIHPDDLQATLKEVEVQLAGGNTALFINRYLCKDGIYKWLEWEAAPATGGLLFAAARDITERKIAEEKIFDSETKFRAIFESALDAMGLSKNGLHYLVNPSYLKMFGYSSADEIVGRPAWDLIAPSEKERIKLFSRNRSEGFPAPSFYETIGERKDGTLFPMEVRVSTYIMNGEVYSVVAERDITERKNAERELLEHRNHLAELVNKRTAELDELNKELLIEIEKQKEAERQLQISLEKEKELGRLKSRFITTASHEFRTPLTALLSSVELIQRYGKRWDEVKITEHIDRIKNSVEYLSHLLDEVLDVSRAEAGKIGYNPIQVNLKEICRKAIEEIQLTSGNRQNFILNYQSVINEFNLDALHIYAILTNLLSNASKYSPEEGNIELDVDSDIETLTITIKDYGLGIPPEDMDKLFEPFHRATNINEIRGTGLGLTIVKNAVDLHNGKIEVNSVLGKGTSFKVEIPLRQN